MNMSGHDCGPVPGRLPLRAFARVLGDKGQFEDLPSEALAAYDACVVQAVEIDLGLMVGPLLQDLRAALVAFEAASPEVEICTVGLHGDGVHGAISLCLDTPDHNKTHVAEWGPKGWIGIDSLGEFCDNCPDFAYWVLDHQLLGFPDLYEVADDAPVRVRGVDGVLRSPDLGDDEAIHVAVAEPLLREAARLLVPFAAVRHAEPFRVVLQFIANEAFDVLNPTDGTRQY